MSYCGRCLGVLSGSYRFCPNCGSSLPEKEAGEVAQEVEVEKTTEAQSSGFYTQPDWEEWLGEISEKMTGFSIIMLYIFALGNILVGAQIFVAFMPDQSMLENGQYYKVEAYIPAIIAASITAFIAVFLIWMGQVLHYLRRSFAFAPAKRE